MDLTTLLVQLVAGVIGGNAAGAASAKTKSLGPMIISILGAVGGLGGGQLLGPTVTDLIGNAIAGSAGSAGIVGAILPMIVGMLKNKAS